MEGNAPRTYGIVTMLPFAVQNATRALRLTRAASGIVTRPIYNTAAPIWNSTDTVHSDLQRRRMQTATKWRPVQVLDEYVTSYATLGFVSQLTMSPLTDG